MSVKTLVFLAAFQVQTEAEFWSWYFLKVAGTLKLPPCWFPRLTVSEKIKHIQMRTTTAKQCQTKDWLPQLKQIKFSSVL